MPANECAATKGVGLNPTRLELRCVGEGRRLSLAAHSFAGAWLKLRSIMAYVPENARWYLADVVIEHKIEDEPRNVIHINTLLVRANSPERAYQRALKLGKDAEHEYQNSDDKTVRVLFRGLRDLAVIYEPLRSGCEIIYSERVGLTEEETAKIVSPKEELGVFEEVQKPSKNDPNYMPKEIMEALYEAGLNDSDMFSD